MDKLILLIAFALLTFGCGHAAKDNSNNLDTLVVKKDTLIPKHDTGRININHSAIAKNWTDSLIENYISHSENELIRLALKDKISEEWLFDQIVNKDTTKYFVFQIGHDVTDKGNTNKRFVTDQWIYVDSLTKKLYEYDLVNDSLIRWTK